MDYEEEKAQEIELLQSMYPDEMTILSPTTYTIQLALQAPTSSKGLATKDNKQLLIVRVEYTEKYPETLPIIELSLEQEEEQDESDDEDESNSPEALVLDRHDLDALKEKAAEEIEENLGFPSIYAVTSSLKDQAETMLQSKQDAIERELDEIARKEEEAEQAKFRGTLVNRENFLIWRTKFKAEMAEKKRLETGKVEEKKRPTGREIFEKGLDGSKNEGDDELGDLPEAVSELAVSEA
ncbi:RWD domain-containing protein [Myxozyma melibiosi]|uniref:RWD domain-containing protein n=1 Tax=Myxozyma melibiosi TaxID=54550 RepID=A0ABR1F9D1_9ASCO